MRIRRIETFCRGMIGLVRVTAEDGLIGFGQMAWNHPEIAAMVLHRQVAPHVLGELCEPIEPVIERAFEKNYKFLGSHLSRAIAGLDTALWDLKGQRSGRPVCECLHASPRRVLRVYGSSMRRDNTASEEVARLQQARDSLGIDAFKIKIGARRNKREIAEADRSETLIPLARRALGEQITLMADANAAYLPDQAVAVGRQLEAHQYAHFEEPCPHERIEDTARVAATLDIPVAGGEQDFDVVAFERMMRLGAVDIVQPDVGYIGGISRCLQVAALAREHGRPCLPHTANDSLLRLFAAHVLAAIPNPGAYLEYNLDAIQPARDPKERLYEPYLTVQDGHVTLPSDPGWGVHIQDTWLAQATRLVSEL